MEQLADDVFHISMMLRHGMNAYVLDDVLVDAGGPPFGRRIAQELRHEQREIAVHVVTHAHGDQAGGSHAIVEECGVPVWAGEQDVEALESGKVVANGALGPAIRVMGNFTGVPVAKALREGDAVGPGFVVLDTPGHTPGHIALWREDDRTLICGDVWFNMSMRSTRSGLRQPPKTLTMDTEANRAAERRLAALEPAMVCFGHGPVLKADAAGTLARWVATEL
jgi:hydroxyacylglutathione hydrolase